jgi:hypothetical protein
VVRIVYLIGSSVLKWNLYDTISAFTFQLKSNFNVVVFYRDGNEYITCDAMNELFCLKMKLSSVVES